MIQATLLNILPWTYLWRTENAVVLSPSALKMEPYIVLEQRTRLLPLGNVTSVMKDQNLGVLPAGSLWACTWV